MAAGEQFNDAPQVTNHAESMPDFVLYHLLSFQRNQTFPCSLRKNWLLGPPLMCSRCVTIIETSNELLLNTCVYAGKKPVMDK